MSAFTTYWKDDQVTAKLGGPISYAASEQFSRVQVGDVVWIVNIQTGTGAFRLIGKVAVAAVLDEAGMKRRYPSDSLYEASHYICAAEGREEFACAIPIDSYATEIRFEGPSPMLELRSGKVYAQQVRSLRTLKPESASLMEDIWLDYKGPVEVPPASEYVRAFQRLGGRVTPIHRQLLAEQYASHGRQVSAGLLADAVCDGEVGTVNLRYGGLAKDLCAELNVKPTIRRDGSSRWWNVLARGWESQDGFIWKMRSEVAEALEILGWVPSGPAPTPAQRLDGEEAIMPLQFREGRATQILVNAYERDRAARAACIAHYSCVCQVCGFDFSRKYGSLGHGFIHVHHVVPLARVAREYVVDPINDLIPVCPNCHAMLHCGKEPPSVAELRGIVRAGS
jgi:5-methylcytosine-specific restriction enzyme A